MLGFAVHVSLMMALSAIAACGGSGDDAQPLSPVVSGVPAPCATAFDEADGSTGKSAQARKSAPARADDGPVVALSSCTVDRQRNVTIGGDGGGTCGPRVVIDRSFTGPDALGKITIAPGGKLAVPHIIPGGTLQVETAGIQVNGLLSVGTAACPIGGADDPLGRVKFNFSGSQIPSDLATDSGSDKGIELGAGGILRLFGAKGVAPRDVNWTQPSRPNRDRCSLPLTARTRGKT